MIGIDELGVTFDMTKGEYLLNRIADALEKGELPNESDSEKLIDAVALMRAMIKEGNSPEERRKEFMRKLGMMKPPHREAETIDVEGARIAEAYWWNRFLDGRENEAIRETMKQHNVSRSKVKRAKEDHPKKCRIALSALADLFGRDDERIQRGIKAMRKFEQSLRDREIMPPEYEEWLEAMRKRHREQTKGS